MSSKGGQPNTPQYHFELYEAQLKKNIDGTELTGDRLQAKYCCIIGDNVIYMHEAGRLIEQKYRMIFAIGCVSHLLDLLSEDWGSVAEIDAIVKLCYNMVLLCKGIEDVLRPFRESTGLWKMFKTYPDTRFTYALLMVTSVLDNWAMLLLFYNDIAWSTAPNGVGKAPCKKNHGDDFDKAMKDPNFKKKLDALKFLLGPLAKSIAYVGGSHAKIACVFPLMTALCAHLNSWATAVDNPYSQETRNVVVTAFMERYTGTTWATNGVRKVGIKKDVHVAAFYFHPAMVPLADNSGRMGLQPGDRDAVARVISRFFPESPTGQAGALRVLHEFDNYVAGEGDFGPARLVLQGETEVLLRDMYESNGSSEPTCPVEKCIHRLTLAQDPRIHWSRQQNISREFNFIQGRLSSMDPASVGPERVNKHYKTVIVSSRASMDHERANKALYVYANLRFLMGVDDSSDKMMELLNLASDGCDAATAMAMESAKVKQLPLPLVQAKHFATAISEMTGVKRPSPAAEAMRITGAKIVKKKARSADPQVDIVASVVPAS